ncbi:hypothetical protein H8356DRAFT_1286802 [Neocallimastix lanati (nom. inval.)]|nr:hypothetical protein H8356DRAFT_1286802 [Neocallimastix sp. JGI-2020a]
MKFNLKKFLQILPLILLCGSNVQALTTSKTLLSKTTSKTLPFKSTKSTLPSKSTIRRIAYPTNVGTVSFARNNCRDPYYTIAKKRDFKSDLLGANSANIQNSLKVKREVTGGWRISGRFDITDSEYKECRDYKTHLEFLDSLHSTKLCFSTCLTGCPEGTTFNKYTGECLNSTEVDEEGWLKNPKCENGVPAKYIEEYDRKCRSIGGKLGFYNNRSLYLSDNCIKNIDNIYCALCGKNVEIYTHHDGTPCERNVCVNEIIPKRENLKEVRERCAMIGGKIKVDTSLMYDCILPMIDPSLVEIRTKTLPNFNSTITTTTTTTISTKTLPISRTTTTTTSTKALPISKTTTITTSTKTLPISKTTTITTSTKALPISKTTTITTSTKTLPISKTTTTSTKTLPISKTTTTTTSTKMLPISTTKSTKCIPITVTVTEKETITKKETVTVTVKSNPTSIEDDRKCAAKYEQCGGINFNGPTCCQSGSTCRELNQYYSQCI